MKGIVESINVKTGDDNRVEEDPFANTDVIDCKPTTRSRIESPARWKDTSLGVYLERSEPPSVRLPKTPVDPGILSCYTMGEYDQLDIL